MSDDPKIPKVPAHPPALLVEVREQADGSHEVDVHGPTCERTREVHQAWREGREAPPPNEGGACKGPAKVTTEAFRRGWDAINWGGRAAVVGQA